MTPDWFGGEAHFPNVPSFFTNKKPPMKSRAAKTRATPITAAKIVWSPVKEEKFSSNFFCQKHADMVLTIWTIFCSFNAQCWIVLLQPVYMQHMQCVNMLRLACGVFPLFHIGIFDLSSIRLISKRNNVFSLNSRLREKNPRSLANRKRNVKYLAVHCNLPAVTLA